MLTPPQPGFSVQKRTLSSGAGYAEDENEEPYQIPTATENDIRAGAEALKQALKDKNDPTVALFIMGIRNQAATAALGASEKQVTQATEAVITRERPLRTTNPEMIAQFIVLELEKAQLPQ